MKNLKVVALALTLTLSSTVLAAPVKKNATVGGNQATTQAYTFNR